jgi:CubicO group peptidase (beta-lactamase class C family)
MPHHPKDDMPHHPRTAGLLRTRRWALTGAAATVALGALGGLSAPAAVAGDRGASLQNRLDEGNWLKAFDVPGVAVAQVRDGALTWSKGYGKADTATEVPVTADTVFQVASISKSVSAWGVMRLVEQGRLDLDAPVETYLTRWHLPASRFDSGGVTIRRLLNHTAGLNTQDYSPVTTRPLPSLEQSLTGGSGQPGDRVGSDDVRITAEPGRQYNYSNGGYTLLQMVVEEITGQPFATYMQREVLNPLGMTHSSYVRRPELAAVTATGYTNGDRAVPPSLFTEQAPSGLYSTANDLARFVAAGMRGPRGERPGRSVLTPAGVAALFARTPVPDGMTTSLGYDVDPLSDGTHAAGHMGKNSGWLTEFITLPDRGEGLVVLTNSDGSGPIGMSAQAWADSLGVGSPMTSQMIQSDMASQFVVMLALAAVFVLAAIGWAAVLLRGHRAGATRWVWRATRRPSIPGWVVRVVVALTAVAAAAAWWTAPLRVTLASITPVRTSVVTNALLALCLTAILATATRAVPRAVGTGPAAVSSVAGR